MILRLLLYEVIPHKPTPIELFGNRYMRFHPDPNVLLPRTRKLSSIGASPIHTCLFVDNPVVVSAH